MENIYVSNISSKYKEQLIEGIEEDIDKFKLKKDEIEKVIKEKGKITYEMIKSLNNISEFNIDSNAIYVLFVKEVRVYEDNRIEIDWRY